MENDGLDDVFLCIHMKSRSPSKRMTVELPLPLAPSLPPRVRSRSLDPSSDPERCDLVNSFVASDVLSSHLRSSVHVDKRYVFIHSFI